MYRLTSKLILYRIPASGDPLSGDGGILLALSDICRRFDHGGYSQEAMVDEIYTQIHQLLRLATRYGFDGNLWHNYLSYLLGMYETPFALVSEKQTAPRGSVNEFARNDFHIFRQLFHYDFSRLEQALHINCFSMITNYQAVSKSERIYNKSVSEKVRSLSDAIAKAVDTAGVYEAVTGFYKTYGVGMLGLCKAFRIAHRADGALLKPITAAGNMTLHDLYGYQEQKRILLQNTSAFVSGQKANNVLLYGDPGTGKSTSVKAVLNQFERQGLRMIELYKHEFKYLNRVIDEIKNRNYRFIIFMDDLSFEEFETEYKYLKAVIEGGLEKRPENILIYATSNRRHLIRESFSDRNDTDELHHSDTMQEKLSLADRFGLMIGYYKPSRAEFLSIVKALAAKNPALSLPEAELLARANQWEMRHGGLSGRTAQQFIHALETE